MQGHLNTMEDAIGRANVCLENIEISLRERENEPPSEIGSEYAPSLQFESASGHSSTSCASENGRLARMMDLQIEQAKKGAQQRLEEEHKRAENLKQEMQLQEHRCLRELAYKADRLRLEAQLGIQDKETRDPDNIENRSKDFEDVEVGTVYREIKPKVLVNADIQENSGGLLPSQNVKLRSPVKLTTLCKETPQINQDHCDTEKRFDVSWIKELSTKQSALKGETNA